MSTRKKRPLAAAQSPASNTSTTSIRAAAEEPSTVSSFQQSFLSFSWTSLLPTSFPRGLYTQWLFVTRGSSQTHTADIDHLSGFDHLW